MYFTFFDCQIIEEKLQMVKRRIIGGGLDMACLSNFLVKDTLQLIQFFST